MHTELVSIDTDSTPLDGAFYRPEGETIGSVLLLHGNTMNFYVGPPRFLPRMLTRLGYACLAFNRRGHDILSTRNSRAPEGATFQLTAEAIADNAYAARWLAEQHRLANPVLIGHSNGGMLAVKHAADHPDTPGLVLLSAHMGGRTLVSRACANGLLAGNDLQEVTEWAQGLVAAGRGRELIQLPGWWYIITAESFVDLLTELPDICALAPRITCPSIFLRGDQEPADLYPAEEFQARAGGPCEVRIVPNCDHFYNGCEAAVTELVADWLERRLQR